MSTSDLPFISRWPRLCIIRQPLDTTANPKVLLYHTLDLRRRQLVELADHASPPNCRRVLCRSFLMRNVAFGANEEIPFGARDRRGFGVFEGLNGV